MKDGIYHNFHNNDLFYFSRTYLPRSPPFLDQDPNGFDYEDVMALQVAMIKNLFFVTRDAAGK